MVRRKMDEKGVSPVIGVILMVAITVILAAVVASFVFGMGQSVKRTYTVSFAVTGVDENKNITVVYHGGPDHQYLTGCKAAVGGGNPSDFGFDKTIGKAYKISAGNETGSTTLSIVCTFTDGTEQVVLNTRVALPST